LTFTAIELIYVRTVIVDIFAWNIRVKTELFMNGGWRSHGRVGALPGGKAQNQALVVFVQIEQDENV
jgi:hypothetical protein